MFGRREWGVGRGEKEKRDGQTEGMGVGKRWVVRVYTWTSKREDRGSLTVKEEEEASMDLQYA